jgi:uncharacterized protein with GYD domain
MGADFNLESGEVIQFCVAGTSCDVTAPKRADAFKALAKKVGASVKDLYWTLGSYDIVAIVESPDVETNTALGLRVGFETHAALAMRRESSMMDA